MGAEISARQKFFEVIFCSKLAKNRYNFKNMGDRGVVYRVKQILEIPYFVAKKFFCDAEISAPIFENFHLWDFFSKNLILPQTSN